MATISATQAKNQFSHWLRKTAEGEEVIVQRRGQPVAVILSFREFQELERLREQARREEVLKQLRDLAEQVRSRNRDLNATQIEQIADDMVRDAVDALMEKGAFVYENG